MYEAVSAGHICIDINPQFYPDSTDAAKVFVPGRLIKTGKNQFSLGGSVGNTGVAMAKLGLNCAQVGKLGDDELGRMTYDLLQREGGHPEQIRLCPGEESSYTIVLAPKGIDRIFLHDAGANDTFCANDIDFEALRGAKLFHLGYPTAMRGMAENGGSELVEVLRRARAAGMSTSLDFSYPDSEMLGFDWKEIFANALPHADMVFPSVEELLMMLEPEKYEAMRSRNPDVLQELEIDDLPALGEKLTGMGVAVAAIKCGTRGYCLKTADAQRLSRMASSLPGRIEDWANRELFSGIYVVDEVKSASGAGDTSIAGFLAAYLRGLGPEDCLNAACAVGALCVTDYSATGAIPHLDAVLERIRSGWEKRSCEGLSRGHFRWDEGSGMLRAR